MAVQRIRINALSNVINVFVSRIAHLGINMYSDSNSVFPFTELTADHKGPLGSAYAFSKPKAQAVKISNSSFILQFASARFVNNFLSE